MWEDNIRRVVPYTPGEQPRKKVIKLNTNECPYPPSGKVLRALREADYEALRLYPDPLCARLREVIAQYYGVGTENTFVGVGSDDVLSMCFLAFFAGKDPVLFPDITYSFYDVWAEVYGIPYRTIPLTEEFSINLKDYDRENGGVVICNPNAPTGVVHPLGEIEEFISANKDSVIIVDEAYIDFGGESAVGLIGKYENLAVVRTMSKSRALAGLRVGYAFGSEKLIGCLNDVKFSVNSYTMNMPSLIGAAAAMEDEEYFQEIRGRIIKTRTWVSEELRALGFRFRDSGTNFLFVTHPEKPAKEIFNKLRERDIFVRYFDRDRIREYLRISIGTDEEMRLLLTALEEILGINGRKDIMYGGLR